jgi:formate hydrogenlyase subunit 3/multisubunit Na+/H+ antiporter MnhD subunit
LVSPSVVSYLIRDQFYHFKPKEKAIEDSYPKKIEYTLYILALKEFNLEGFLNFVLWRPLKTIGKSLDFLNIKRIYIFFIPLYLIGFLTYKFRVELPSQIANVLPEIFAFIGLVFVFKSFSERRSPFLAWILIVMNHFWIALAIVFNDKVSVSEIIYYLAGVVVAGIIGYIALLQLSKLEKRILINQYLGHVYEHPKFAFFFLVATLGITGFPITSTFIGEDLIFSHIDSQQLFLAFFVASSFVVSGIAGIRIYARLFLGPHVKTYHELPYRSS